MRRCLGRKSYSSGSAENIVVYGEEDVNNDGLHRENAMLKNEISHLQSGK